MKEYKYCQLCKKKDPYRIGEGYLVIAVRNDIEVIKECPACHGFGYIFVKEYEVTNDGCCSLSC